jgi:hypothetical protein
MTARYWDEPTKFMPERFLKPYNKEAFVPFSGGPRACIGRRFTEGTSLLSPRALIEAKPDRSLCFMHALCSRICLRPCQPYPSVRDSTHPEHGRDDGQVPRENPSGEAGSSHSPSLSSSFHPFSMSSTNHLVSVLWIPGHHSLPRQYTPSLRQAGLIESPLPHPLLEFLSSTYPH